jgi:hypothetical protein
MLILAAVARCAESAGRGKPANQGRPESLGTRTNGDTESR